MIFSIKVNKIASIGIMLLGIISCNQKDFLETTDKSNLTDNTMWASDVNADIFLNDCYSELPQKSNEADNIDNFTDDATMTSYFTSYNWKRGIIVASSNDYDPWGEHLCGPAVITNWPGTYSKIRKINTFIQKVTENSENFSEEFLAKRIDEARFLRAYFYSELFMHLGGLCIITEPLDRMTMTSDELCKPRSSFEETLNFIVAELDTVLNNGNLAVKYNHGDSDAGRATLGAALALKGWLQLYAASPAYNSSSPAVPATSGYLQSFADPDPQRWAIAAATNKKFIETFGHKGSGEYSLYPKMSEFWWEANEHNCEVVWDRQQVPTVMPNYYNTYGGPVWIFGTYYTWGNYNPTQELVDEFQMANGKNIDDPTSGYDDQNPYAARENRFYDFIVYDGAPYKQDWMSATDTIYTRIDLVHPSKNEIDFGGADATQTGYFFKKKIDNLNPPGGSKCGMNNVYYRYAEVLLNYAEAQNEAVGPDASVYEAVNAIRTRPGTDLPELQPGLTKEEMREAIHHERRIELAYEGKRFYDLMRWKLAEVNLNLELHGIKITNSVPSNNSGKWVYERISTNYGHVFTPKMYFNPIPFDAIDQNPKLIQNWGY